MQRSVAGGGVAVDSVAGRGKAEAIYFLSMDVSFISATLVLPAVLRAWCGKARPGGARLWC